MNAIRVELDIDRLDDADRYNEMLNEIYGDVEIAGIPYATSYALKRVDETAYNCGFNDWANNEEPLWCCEECGREFQDEESAEDCCKEE